MIGTNGPLCGEIKDWWPEEEREWIKAHTCENCEKEVDKTSYLENFNGKMVCEDCIVECDECGGLGLAGTYDEQALGEFVCRNCRSRK